jgi:class 3 adenylate cyclase
MSDHPSEHKEHELGPPVEWRFLFDVNVTPNEIWPVLIDTNRLNRSMGLSPIQFVEQDGELRGTARVLGVLSSWIEPAWSWVAGKGASSVRNYENGPLKRVQITFTVEPRGASGSRINLHFAWFPRSALAGPLLALVARVARFGYARAVERLERDILEKKPAYAILASRAPPLGRDARQRLFTIRERLQADGVRANVIDAIIAHIEGGDELELSRLRPLPLARRWGIDERELVVAFLYATRAGLVRLGWDLICPHCRGVRQTVRILGELPPTATCAPCAVELETDAPRAIEISFSIDPAIRALEKKVYCLAESTSKEHIKLQQRLEAGERRDFNTALAPGRYRVRIRGEKRYRSLDIIEESPRKEVRIDPSDEGSLEAAASPVVRIDNTKGEQRTFVIEDVAWVDDALRPAMIFGLHEFRDLFAGEYIAADVQIEVGEQTILFSDMIGSTRFYERHGDARAFAAVKRHFQEVHAIVRASEGVVVKTIGDAAMAAFHTPAAALKAALELQERFHPDHDDLGILIRISLNMGSCIAVSLNSGIDYFGRTVNLAAKLQACVSAGQIAFPEALRRDPRAQSFLEEHGADIEGIAAALPFSEEPVHVCRWDVHRGSRAPAAAAVRSPLSTGFY